MSLTPIQDCKLGHCCFHFPQFVRYEEKEMRESLIGAIESLQDEREYAFRAYTNRETLVDEYKKILEMPFLDGCAVLTKLEKSYVRPILYLDKRGGVAKFKPCCA